MKYIFLLFFILIGCNKTNLFIIQSNAKTIHPCDFPPRKFNMQNLNDLESLTRFQRLNQIYPWFNYQCNGATCTMEEFEKMCYNIRQDLIHNKDPNIEMPFRIKLIEEKYFNKRNLWVNPSEEYR